MGWPDVQVNSQYKKAGELIETGGHISATGHQVLLLQPCSIGLQSLKSCRSANTSHKANDPIKLVANPCITQVKIEATRHLDHRHGPLARS
jgi:hypothetical protein